MIAGSKLFKNSLVWLIIVYIIKVINTGTSKLGLAEINDIYTYHTPKCMQN